MARTAGSRQIWRIPSVHGACRWGRSSVAAQPHCDICADVSWEVDDEGDVPLSWRSWPTLGPGAIWHWRAAAHTYKEAMCHEDALPSRRGP